ncbi:hypothetical protein GC194_02200 [bacterium]|nr:hypothetical protein [bacterium]
MGSKQKIRILVVVSLILCSFPTIGQNEYYLLIQKVFSSISETDQMYFQLEYKLYTDSSSKTPIDVQKAIYWKNADGFAIQRGNTLELNSGDLGVQVNHDDKYVVIFHSASGNSNASSILSGIDSNLSSVQSVQHRQVSGLEELRFNYPWNAAVSSYLLQYEPTTYYPRKAIVYSRTPVQVNDGSWVNRPRLEMNYSGFKNENVQIPFSLDNYIEKTASGYKLREDYSDYKLYNQTLN